MHSDNDEDGPQLVNLGPILMLLLVVCLFGSGNLLPR
jgi:hypothetical protein